MSTEIPAAATAQTAPGARKAVSAEEFEVAVSQHRLKIRGAASEKPLIILGTLLMAGGLIGAFLEYNVSLSQDDARDIASTQILVIAFLVMAVVGTALFVAGSLTRVLKVWLLRQLLEGQARDEQLREALATALRARP